MVVGQGLPFRARHDEGRARCGSVARSAAAAFKPASVSAPAFDLHACLLTACASLRTTDAQLHRSLRFVGALASAAYRLEALGDARAMDVV